MSTLHENKEDMEIYMNRIGQQLNHVLPSGWLRIVYAASFCEESINSMLYVKRDGAYIDALDSAYLRNINFRALGNCNDATEEWRLYCKQHDDPWLLMTFVLENDGAFYAHYGYEEADSLMRDAHLTAWKAKYLV